MTVPLVLGPAPERYDRADQDRVRQAASGSVMTLLRQFGTRTATATLPFSATPTFDAANLSVFRLSLTANVTSSTLLNGADGQPLIFLIKQDPAVARTFVWPANVKGAMVISAGLSTVSAQVFVFDAASNNAYALSPGVVGM